MNHATGFRSAASTSHPSRIASSGIAPPPANGSSTRGARPPKASRTSSRKASSSRRFSFPQWKIPSFHTRSTTSPSSSRITIQCPAIRSNTRRRSEAPESGSSVERITPRLAASGLRAGQMCRVEICPCRTFFSWTESPETCSNGNATSINRFPDSLTADPLRRGGFRRAYRTIPGGRRFYGRETSAPSAARVAGRRPRPRSAPRRFRGSLVPRPRRAGPGAARALRLPRRTRRTVKFSYPLPVPAGELWGCRLRPERRPHRAPPGAA